MTSDHVHTTESGSCMVETRCFIGGCLPKNKYSLQCGLSLKTKGLPDSSITLPTVTGNVYCVGGHMSEPPRS